ncbi:hypothetical protein P4H42_20830 [Paenibacillus macerans]|nr:hypothetical protein [Paenibacillus macerans]MEC0332047.1 hypothetical protein [Paenibacillus macerans]
MEADLMFLIDEPNYEDFVDVYRKVHNDLFTEDFTAARKVG